MVAGREFAHRLERKAIKKALVSNRGNLVETAESLKMPYSTLNYKIRVLGLKEEAAFLREKARANGFRITGRKPGSRNKNSLSKQAKLLLALAESEEE